MSNSLLAILELKAIETYLFVYVSAPCDWIV
jgi:hypothetical protein